MTNHTLTPTEKAEGILRIFDQPQLMEFLSDAWELFQLYDFTEEQDEQLNNQLLGELREVRLIKTAIALSRLADNNAKRFKKITSRYPGFASQCEDIAAMHLPETHRVGKTLC